MALRIEQSHNLEMNLKADDLKYESRKRIGREYFDWIFLVGGLRVKFQSLVALIFIIIGVSFFTSEWLLLALFPVFVATFMAQFDWGDKLDDKETWEEKSLTVVQGAE